MKEQGAESAAFEVSDTEFLRITNVQRFEDGSGYCGQIAVRAGEFACTGRGFYFDELPLFVEQLRHAYQTLSGQAELRQRYEEEFVRFVFDSRGHVLVTGFLTDYSEPGCSFRFGLDADQTHVPSFISGLERLVRELHA